MAKGKFIVIDGTDGSGKTTQWYLLAKKLRQEKISYQLFNFPVYQSFFGQLIKRYLKGDFGDPIKFDPYFSSLPYALDRFFYKEKMDKALKEKRVVLVNRYVTSNLIYQGAKIKNKKERENYFRFEEKLEHDILKVRKPDLIIYLWMSPFVSARLLKKRTQKTQDKYEKNLRYQRAVARVAEALAKRRKWQMIQCCKNGILLSRQEIAKRVWEIVRNKLNS